jgi:hypothetical protein
MDQLMQEIIQFYGGKSITFTRVNNQKGTLAVVQSIADSTSSTVKDAASCLLSVLISKYEDSFVSVAIEKCVMERHFPQKMDIVAAEAMLQEANINNTNARILFCHLKRFFGRSYFELEQKRRTFFGDTDFPPTVDKIVHFGWVPQ